MINFWGVEVSIVSIITMFVTLITSIVMIFKINKVHITFNSKMDKYIELLGVAKKAEGVLEEKTRSEHLTRRSE